MTKEELLKRVDDFMNLNGALTWETPLQDEPDFDSLSVTNIVNLVDLEFDVLLKAVAVRAAKDMNEIVQLLQNAGVNI